MELSKRYHHIDVGQTYQGILKFCIAREFEKFIIQLELYKLSTSDNNVIDLIRNDSLGSNILNKVDNQLTDSTKINYYEVESYLLNIEKSMSYFKEHNIDYNKIFNFNIASKIKVPLNVWQFRRLYYDLKSFYENYFLLETVFKITVNYNADQENTKKSEKIVDKVGENKEQFKRYEERKETFNNQTELENIKDQKNEISEDDQIIFDIFGLSINSLVSTSLVHQFFIYYQYANNNYCFVKYDEDENVNINILKLFSNPYVFNVRYFKSIIISTSTYTLDDISFLSNKLVNNFERVEDKPIYLMMLSYLLFVYCLRYTYETHTQQFLERFEDIVLSPKMQERAINHFLKSYNFNKITFKIHDVDIDFNCEGRDDLISELSENYSYMMNVSQKEFADKILNESNSQNINTGNLPEFKNPEVFDLNQILINIQYHDKKVSKLFNNNLLDPNNTVETEEKNDDLLLNLFKYDNQLQPSKSNNIVVSYPYKKLIDYLNDPDTIFVKDDKIPKQVVNYFDWLKTILTPQNFHRENIKTLSYYKILVDNAPDPKVIPHTLILYFIYQIIIPYYYDFYGISKFEDCLV